MDTVYESLESRARKWLGLIRIIKIVNARDGIVDLPLEGCPACSARVLELSEHGRGCPVALNYHKYLPPLEEAF